MTLPEKNDDEILRYGTRSPRHCAGYSRIHLISGLYRILRNQMQDAREEKLPMMAANAAAQPTVVHEDPEIADGEAD
jgi:hypothetical protein